MVSALPSVCICAYVYLFVCGGLCIYMNMDCTVCTYFVHNSQIMMCLHFIKLDVR